MHFTYLNIILFCNAIQQSPQMMLAMLRWAKSKTAKNVYFKDLWSINVSDMVLHFPLVSAKGHKTCTKVTHSVISLQMGSILVQHDSEDFV